MDFSGNSASEKNENSSRINLANIKLNKIQEDIMNSIETLNYSLFVDLGGSEDTDLNFKRKVGSTELYPIMSATAKGSEEMMRLILMNKTVEINQLNESGVNAFWVACMYGHGGLMKILADKGINIFCKNNKQVNALHLAVDKNAVGIVEMLLGSGFPLDCETDTGMTAFQLAAYKGHLQIIKVMMDYLSKNCDEEIKNFILNKVNPISHLSTLAYSILHQNQEISILLTEFGARTYYDKSDQEKDFSPIFMAI